MERIVDLTPDIAQTIEVIRFKLDSKDGFQRELDHSAANAIARAAKEKTFIPPIFIGELPDKRKVLIDGQHRLHAYKIKKFPLKAIIYKCDSIKDAKAQFIAVNGYGRRVSLRFRLNVDPGTDAKWIRDMAERYETIPAAVYNLIVGIVNPNRFNTAGRRVNHHAKSLAKRIMDYWTQDKRWNDRAYLYSSVAVLKIVGSIVGESTNPEETMKFLNGLDWTKRSRIGAITGSSWVFQGKMYNYITRAMKLSGKGHYLQPKDPKKVALAAKRGFTTRTA